MANQPVIIEDFFPSILEMANIINPKIIQKLDGKSFVTLLKGEEYPDKDRLLVWHSPNKWTKEGGPGINYFSAARQGKWKLVYDYRQQKLELYNLDKDLGEHNDLAKKEKKVVVKLAAALSDQLRKWDALMPTYKATGKPVAWPDEIK